MAWVEVFVLRYFLYFLIRLVRMPVIPLVGFAFLCSWSIEASESVPLELKPYTPRGFQSGSGQWLEFQNDISNEMAFDDYFSDIHFTQNSPSSETSEPDYTVWVASSNGLLKYDGLLWSSFRDEEVLDSNYFRSIVELESGEFMVGTQRGIYYFNPESGQFRRHPRHDFLKDFSIRRMKLGLRGNVWVAGDGYPDFSETRKGLLSIEGDEVVFHENGEGLPSAHMLDILVDPVRGEFVVSPEGISIWDGTSWSLVLSRDGNWQDYEFPYSVAVIDGVLHVSLFNEILVEQPDGTWRSNSGTDTGIWSLNFFLTPWDGPQKPIACSIENWVTARVQKVGSGLTIPISEGINLSWGEAFKEAPDGSFWALGKGLLARWVPAVGEFENYSDFSEIIGTDPFGRVWFKDGTRDYQVLVFKNGDSWSRVNNLDWVFKKYNGPEFSGIGMVGDSLVEIGENSYSEVGKLSDFTTGLFKTYDQFEGIWKFQSPAGAGYWVLGYSASGDGIIYELRNGQIAWVGDEFVEGISSKGIHFDHFYLHAESGCLFGVVHSSVSDKSALLKFTPGSGEVTQLDFEHTSMFMKLFIPEGGDSGYIAGPKGVFHFNIGDDNGFQFNQIRERESKIFVEIIEHNRIIYFFSESPFSNDRIGVWGWDDNLGKPSGVEIPASIKFAHHAGNGRFILGNGQNIYLWDEKYHSGLIRLNINNPVIPEALANESGNSSVWMKLDRNIVRYNPKKSPPRALVSLMVTGHTNDLSVSGKVKGMLAYHPYDRAGEILYSWRIDNGPWTSFAEWPEKDVLPIKSLSAGRHDMEFRLMDSSFNIGSVLNGSHGDKFKFYVGAVPINERMWFRPALICIFFLITSFGVVTYITKKKLAQTLEKFRKSTRELEKNREKLSIAVRDAREASDAKSRFLANMSHEIRTPLNAIIGMTDILGDADLGGEEKKIIRLSRVAAENLLTLINDILDLSKIEAGKLKIEAYDFSPRELAGECLEIFRPLAAQKGLVLKSDHDDSVPSELTGDSSRIRQIIFNLLNNSVKFTSQGEIKISIQAVPGPDEDTADVRFTVSDTGIGIPEHRRAAVFQEFEQADISTTRQFGGTGLGLPICVKLARLMEGDLTLLGPYIRENSLGGEGSVFQLRLMMHVPKSHNSSSTIATTSDSMHAALKFENLKVLVAEDNRVNQVFIQSMLRKLGCLVTLVENGEDALAALESFPFDVVLMDLHMPVMDGLEAARRIKSLVDESWANTPIIALTAAATDEDRDACIEAGMDGFLTKPLVRAKLLECFQKLEYHGRIQNSAGSRQPA